MSGKVLMKRRGILRSNLDRPSLIERPWCFLLPWTSVRQGDGGLRHGRWFGQLLRDLDVERNSFCRLTVVEMDGGKLAMRRRLGQSSTAVGASSGSTLALGLAPAAVERLRQPPSGLGLARQASGWHDTGGLVWKRERQWGKVLGRSSEGPIYRGEGTGERAATA
jgi:hypothetical protein